MRELRKHDRIQKQILLACNNLGIKAKQEHSGKGWRADVFVERDNALPIAFEIQLSPQSLNKTLQRQVKYANSNVIGCWLFENPIPKLIDERPDLPVFYVEETDQRDLLVNLGDRRKISLEMFLENFIANRIQFKQRAVTGSKQNIKLRFYEMNCWKCKELNHLYYVETPFYATCNAEIKPDEALWESNSIEYIPEIIAFTKSYVENRPELNLHLAQIKERFSNTVGDSYVSFGCCKCDSLFGDFYVMEAKLDVMYDPNTLFCEGDIELKQNIDMNIPHWCFPSNGCFCND